MFYVWQDGVKLEKNSCFLNRLDEAVDGTEDEFLITSDVSAVLRIG